MRRTVKLNLLERLHQKVQMVDYGSHITQNCIKNVTKKCLQKTISFITRKCRGIKPRAAWGTTAGGFCISSVVCFAT